MKRERGVWLLIAALALVAALSMLYRVPVTSAPWAEGLETLALGDGPVEDVELGGNALDLLGVDRYRFVELEDAARAPVWLYAGYYAGQRSDARIHAPEHCYPGSGFEIVASRRTREASLPVRELLIERRGQRRLVWYGYATRVGHPLSPLALKRDQLLATVLGRSRDAILIRLSTPLLDLESESEARERIASAWKRQGLDLIRWYQRGGG